MTKLTVQTLIVQNDLRPKVCLAILEHFLVSAIEFSRVASTDPDWVRNAAQKFLSCIALSDRLMRS